MALTSAAFGPMWRLLKRSVHANGRGFAAPFTSVSVRVCSGAKVVSAIKEATRYDATRARQAEDMNSPYLAGFISGHEQPRNKRPRHEEEWNEGFLPCSPGSAKVK